MTIPEPPHPLENHCTTIWNNTFYVYSPEAFQSLPLSANGNWAQEAMGIAVTGATCTQGTVEGDNSKPAFFIVGGSTNSSSIQYPGLQRYSFLEKKWDTVTPAVRVTENRQHHGSTFLNSSSALLVYAGSQDGIDGPSTQTFMISTVAPYGVQAFNSDAPPVTDPIVLPWNETTGAMMGGDASNTRIFLFTPGGAGWADSGVTLGQGIPQHSQASCAIVSLNDGSKVLETFDMASSPNTVTRTVLIDPDGAVASVNRTVGDPSSTDTNPAPGKRDLTLDDFPAYNATLAPTVTRQDFSLAQGPNGLVVISGGSKDDVLCIFNSTENGWVNATQLLKGSQSTLTLGSSSTTSTGASATGGPAASSSAGSKGGSSTHNSTNKSLVILGSVLGAIFGIAAICIATLLILRWLKKRKHGQHKRRQSDYPPDKVRRRSTSFSFHEQDQSLQPFSKAGVPMAKGPVPTSDSAAVFKEVGERPWIPPIPQTRSTFNQPAENRLKPPMSRPIPLQTVSEESTKRSVPSSGGITKASSDEIDPSMKQAANRKTDEGWSKYFQGNNAVNLTERRETLDSQGSRSDYRDSGWPDLTSPRSVTEARYAGAIGPQLRRGNVPMGSPSLEHPATNGRNTGLAVSDGIPGKISSADSVSSSASDEEVQEAGGEAVDYDRIGEAYSSGIPASIQDDQNWSALGNYRNPNRTSSNYTPSYYPPTSISAGPTDMTQATVRSALPAPLNARPTTQWPVQDGDPQRGLPAPIINGQGKPARPQRPSDASEQMRDYFGENPGRAMTPSDMSWLNLGNHR